MAGHRIDITVTEPEEITVQLLRKEPFRPIVLLGVGGDQDALHTGHIVRFPGVESLREFHKKMTQALEDTRDWKRVEADWLWSRLRTGNTVSAVVRLEDGDRLDIICGSDIATVYSVPEALVMKLTYRKLAEMERAVGEALEEGRPGRAESRKNGRKPVNGASFITPRLHVHRDQEQAPGGKRNPAGPRDSAPLPGNSGSAPQGAGDGRAAPGPPALGRPGSPPQGAIAFPHGSGGSFSGNFSGNFTGETGPPGGGNPAARAAAVEIALAWLEAGLIDRLCDLSRWKRVLDTTREEDAAAAEALERLGVRVNAGPRPWPERPHSPDPEGLRPGPAAAPEPRKCRTRRSCSSGRGAGETTPGTRTPT